MNKVTDEQIINELVKIFSDEERIREYNYDSGATHQCILGWCGSMSPVNRKAFVEDFGIERVENAENEAKKIISDKEKEFKSTNYAAHVREADENTKIENFIPSEGNFVWAVETGTKNDRGDAVRDQIRDFIIYRNDPDFRCLKTPVLVFVEKAFKVNQEQFNDGSFPDKLVMEFKERGEHFPGGGRTDDDKYVDLKDEYRTWYTMAAAVIDDDGRWYLINSEGFGYARYILLPVGWETMFAETKASIEEQIEKEHEEYMKKVEEQEAENKKKYEDRCEKWEDVMTDVSPLIEKRSILNEKFRKTSYRQPEYEKIKKECSDIDREILTIQKRNISAMVKKAFPGLKHKVRKGSGYRYDFEVEYIDGPTEDEFIEKTDFGLFVGIYTYFDGMTDSTNYSRAKYTDFAKKYIGDCDSSEVEVIRRCNPETTNRIANEIEEMFPELKDRGERDFTISEVQSIATRLGCDTDNLQRRIDGYRSLTSNDVAIKAWHSMSFYNNVDNRQKEYGGEENKESKESEFAVIDYNERCIAVTGDTKPLSGKLKKIGMYNSRLSCGPGWVFSKKNKDKLKEADKLLGGAISKKFPELLK